MLFSSLLTMAKCSRHVVKLCNQQSRWSLCQNSNCVRRRFTQMCNRAEIGALHKCNNIERCYCIVSAALSYCTSRKRSRNCCSLKSTSKSFFLTTYSMSNFLSSNAEILLWYSRSTRFMVSV